MVKKKKSIIQRISKKFPVKKILKPERPTVTIKEKDVPSVLGDENRFFKDEMEEVKKTVFLK